MPATISRDLFRNELLAILTETFETHHGIYLDGGTTLFETLESVSAEVASVPVGGKCATLAAQVAHVNFYLEVLERLMMTGSGEAADWGEVWRTVAEVTPAEWAGSQQRLRTTYRRILGMLQEREDWDNEDVIAGSLAMVVHTAYHLGEIRQALCTLRA